MKMIRGKGSGEERKTVCRQGRMDEDGVDLRTGQQKQRLSIGAAQPNKQRGLPAQKGNQQGTTATAAAAAATDVNTPTSTTPAHPTPVPFPSVRRGRQRARGRGGGEGEGQGLQDEEAGVDDAQGKLTGSQYCGGRRGIGKGDEGVKGRDTQEGGKERRERNQKLEIESAKEADTWGH